jgi:NitT/TauT family transport system substrate-binding protein
MQMHFRSIAFSFLAAVAVLLSTACGSSTAPPLEGSTEPVNLKIALLPVLDALPMYVAQQAGLFELNGVRVEFIPVPSAPERDQVVSSGQADGMINEAVSTLFYNREETRLQIVRYARTATAETALFRILSPGSSGITTPDGLKGVEIGVSQGTVIEYLTERLLEQEGFGAAEIITVAVPKIDVRMSLLASGELKAAMLPEPLSSLAEQQGAVVVLDDTRHPEFSFSTISFRKEVIDASPEAIRGFLAAIEQATSQINDDPTRWSGLMAEQNLVPAPLLETFQVPQFPTAGLPTESQWLDALEWAKTKGLIDVDVSYSSSINPAFLPK